MTRSSDHTTSKRGRWVRRCWAGAGLVVTLGVTAGCSQAPEPLVPPDLPADATNVLYLHHSVGGDVWDAGVADAVAGLTEGRGVSLNIVDRYFPHEPYPDNENDPYDYWKIWVDSTGDKEYLEQETLEHLTTAFDVIVWKNCFLAGDLTPDTGSPDVSSEVKSVENHKLQYLALREKMAEFPDVAFLVWTVPPKVEGGTSPQAATLAQEFADWVSQEWDRPGDNIHLWDYRALATGGDGVYLKSEYAAGPQDSHPNRTLAERAAPLFAARLVAVVDGRGDESSLTGE